MNRQIQDFIEANETKIFNKVGKVITKRAIALLEESIIKDAERMQEWRENGYKVPVGQPMEDDSFQETVRRIIRGEAVSLEQDSIAPRIAKNQIVKATNEYMAMLEKKES